MANPLKGQQVKLERLRNDCLGSLEILAEHGFGEDEVEKLAADGVLLEKRRR